jgi:hypothetical protein
MKLTNDLFDFRIFILNALKCSNFGYWSDNGEMLYKYSCIMDNEREFC